jgi:SAM-dependent methyltransferase
VPAEQKFLFTGINRLINFDIRPLVYVDLVMDIHDMGRIDDASVDTFVALHVLNHVEDDARALAEVTRVLKAEGLAILTVPCREGSPTKADDDPLKTYGSESRERYGIADYRTYGRGDFRALLARDFRVEEFPFADPLVGATQTVFVARKPRRS